jgi:hypothetical protein
MRAVGRGGDTVLGKNCMDGYRLVSEASGRTLEFEPCTGEPYVREASQC